MAWRAGARWRRRAERSPWLGEAPAAIVRPLHRRPSGWPGRRTFEVFNPANGQVLARVAQGSAAGRRRGGQGRARGVPGLAQHARPYARRATCTRWRARFRSTVGCSRCSRRSTTASRSASRATWTCRWSRATSPTTPAGRSSWPTSCRGTRRWAWSARSSPGIFRC